MTRHAALTVLLTLCPAAASADLCAQLRGLAEGAAAGASQPAPITTDAGAGNCTVAADERGGKTYLCHWSFPYRDAAATGAFAALDQEIRHCFDNAVTLPADTAVNHPDSYVLKRYQTGDLVISASLKDKAALSQSLVFLRMDRP